MRSRRHSGNGSRTSRTRTVALCSGDVRPSRSTIIGSRSRHLEDALERAPARSSRRRGRWREPSTGRTADSISAARASSVPTLSDALRRQHTADAVDERLSRPRRRGSARRRRCGRSSRSGHRGRVPRRPRVELDVLGGLLAFVAGFVGVSNVLERDGKRFTVRPEKIRILDEGEPADGLQVEPGRIAEVAYAGMITRYYVNLNAGAEFRSCGRTSKALCRGDGTARPGGKSRMAAGSNRPHCNGPQWGGGPPVMKRHANPAARAWLIVAGLVVFMVAMTGCGSSSSSSSSTLRHCRRSARVRANWPDRAGHVESNTLNAVSTLGDVAGLGRPPPVPHRHRHPVAGPARGTRDRARLLRPGARRRRGWPRTAAQRSTTSRASCTTRSTTSAAGASISSTRGSARLCWLPTSPAGRRRRRPAAPRRAAVHPRGASGAVVDGDPRPTVCWSSTSRTSRPRGHFPNRDLRRPRRAAGAPDTIQFNHGLGEIVTALLDAGMRVTMLTEHDSVPWNALGDVMEEGADGEWRLRLRSRTDGADVHAAGRQGLDVQTRAACPTESSSTCRTGSPTSA